MVRPPEERPIRLNLGCGMTGLEGWINMDADPLIPFRFALRGLQPLIRRGFLPFSPTTFEYYLRNPTPPDFMLWNFARKRLPFGDESVDAVFSSHALEHFPRFVGRQILGEVHRVLRPGGVVRIVVPDIQSLARRYLAGVDRGGVHTTEAEGPPVTARDVNYEFYRGRAQYHIAPRTMFDRIDLEALYGRLFGVRGHMYMYDFLDLRDLLVDAGFHRVDRQDFRSGVCPDISELDSRPTESLFVEAFS